MVLVLAAMLVAPPGVAAQDDALGERVMAAVRAAMTPALPFPATDAEGVFPAVNDTASLWMVRPHQPGDRAIEVMANPLNEVNQARGARAMAQIKTSIEAAQRRAQAQYERAVAEAKRTGRSQDVDGVTLSDEGVAGARVDAESHVTIDVVFNQPSYRFEIASSVEPAPARQLVIPGAAAVIVVPSNVFRDERGDELFCEGETQVYLGRLAAPAVDDRDGARYEVTAAATASENGPVVTSMVVRLRGNETLIAEVVRRTSWTAILELLK